MQIRLTVLAPRSGQSSQGAARACDVLVTAPAGTALAAVASALAAAVSGPEAPSSGTVVLYAGRERLDAQRCALGEPPLVDGAVLSLQAPAEDEAADHEGAAARTQLHVIAGPDAGGVHLLHEGRIRIGRAAEADVPLDDPDVSRLHCEVTVAEDGGVTVADLGSTNGTTLDGTAVGRRPVRLGPGALLRIGESTLRLAAAQASPDSGSGPPVPDSGPSASGSPAHEVRPVTAPDGEGHLRVRRPVPDPAPDADRADRVPSWAGAREAGEQRAAAPGTASASLRDDGGPYRGRADGQGPASTAGVRGDHGDAGGRPGIPDPRGTAPGGRRPAGASPTAHAGGITRPDGPDSGDARQGRTGAPGGHPPDAAAAPGTADADVPGTGRAGASPYGGRPATGGGAGAGSGRFGTGGPDPYGGDRTRRDGHHPGARDTAAAVPAYGTAPRTDPTHDRRNADVPGGPDPYGRDDGSGRDLHGVRTGGGSPGRAPAADGATTHGTGVVDGLGSAGSRPEGPDSERGGRRRRGIGAWARRLAGARDEPGAREAGGGGSPSPAAEPTAEIWPDPAAVLLTALGPGPRLWERDAGHPENLVVRLGTADRSDTPAVPVTVGLREAGSLGLAGPRARLMGLVRSVVAQAAALHSPAELEIVLISTDRARPLEERRKAWGWLGWLPHLRPGHGQDCRLLLAYDRDQATARAAELTRRLDDGPLGPGWPSADRRAVEQAAARHTGPRTLVVLDGDPGSAALRETTARLAGGGAAAGIHLVCLAETPPASPLSPVAATYEEACAASPAFRECGAVGLLSGDVATALRLLRTAGGHPAGHGTVGVVDAVSEAWAERFGRALAPLLADGEAPAHGRAMAAPLPRSARLLDELGLARATPASLMARWASAAPGTAVLGAGPGGPVAVDLTSEAPHLIIEGPAGSGRTELLRAIAASLAAGGRPDRLGLLLVDGAGGERGEGLAALTDLPHVTEHLVASDPLRMRAFAQALGAELKRRAELLGREAFEEWHTRREVSERLVGQRPPSAAESRPESRSGTRADARGDLDPPPSGMLRLRPAGGRARTDATGTGTPRPLPRLVVLVDDYDALVAPALGSPGRPAAGSVVRALEAVARDGQRLGVHLVATSARPDRTADTELARSTRLRAVLDTPPAAPGLEDPAPGRGRLGHPDGRVTPFQSGRVTGRIPRTATLRPTVVELAWERMGDPPARRPVRELGNGPTDLALLASALDRAARSVDAAPVPPLTPARP
ncbi:FHA domain-containing protein [Streptomyces sp. HNM0645]|uniref:FtsK/SpoIIIE domain-containing protein n=1 Tax=Streptomyces sp. HNM0645 TaxID=2782343 RepID=UPI0024B755FC|nr:FtsK/SpoIIIE domain-containing protein [Streptomyces sp. HNM0645]MDI9886170.1 FHA domain-containing protein [Streptomyces sp. HNM0645]